MEEARQRTLVEEFQGLRIPISDNPEEVEASKDKRLSWSY